MPRAFGNTLSWFWVTVHQDRRRHILQNVRGYMVAQQKWNQPPAMEIDPKVGYTATMNTSEGTITIRLLPEEAPKTVNNFVFLARQGYYDGVIFHRVIDGFMIQTGDPTG